MTQDEGIQLIAEYMGDTLSDYGLPILKDFCRCTVGADGKFQRPSYNNNWQYQIPVYSKLAKEIKEVADNDEDSIISELQHAQIIIDYQVAILENSPQQGFEIICENLKWLQDNKK